MAYGFETGAFSNLGGRLRDYSDPDGIPQSRETLHELSELYIAAAEALFHLMFLIMHARFENSRQASRYRGVLDIYQDRVSALLNELRAFLYGGLERDDTASVRDFLEGVRRSAIVSEMEVLQYAVENSGLATV